MKNFNRRLVETILEGKNKKFDEAVIEDVSLYVSASIHKMPDFMKLGVSSASMFLNYVCLLVYLKKFESLGSNRRITIISFVKKRNVILLALLVRLHETLILNRYYEHD